MITYILCMNLRERERGYGTKRKEEIRKSIIACDNDIVKLRSQAENLEEIIKIKSERKNVLRVNAISMKSKGRKKDKIREYVMFNTEC